MSTLGSSLLRLNLLIFGARSSLLALCQVGRLSETRLVDSTFALQFQAQHGEEEVVSKARSATPVPATSPLDYHPLPDVDPASAHVTGDHFATYGHHTEAGDATFPADGFSADLGSHHLEEIGNWVPSNWGPCQGGCQRPVRTRQVVCSSLLNYSVMSDRWCTYSPKPIMVESCSCSPVGLEVCSPLAENCLEPQDEDKQFHMSLMPGYVEVGCFELAPRDRGAAHVCVREESRDTSCENWRFPMPCRSGFPFYTFCRNLQGAASAVEAHMFERECFEKCIHKGMDMAAVVEGLECRCGATPNNVAVWRSDTVPAKMVFNADSVFAVKAIPLNYGTTCPLKVLQYTGAYETGFVPIQYFDANVLDQAYVDSIVLGHDIAPESEEEKPNLDFMDYDVGRIAVGGGGNRSSDDPAWLRPCYPSNCASSRGPWVLRQTDAPAGLPSGVDKAWEEYTIVPYMFEDGVQPMDETRKEAFRAAAAEWSSHTCIVLKEAPNATALDSSGDYISVKVEDLNYCYVVGGLGYGMSTINMGWCSTMSHLGNIVHEIGHALGMLHEQQRQDAQVTYHGHGPHLEIFWEQIDQAWRSQYLPVDTSYIGSGHDRDRDPWDAGYAPYDFGSLMHYPSANRFKTIPEDEISRTGQRVSLSAGDILQINDMYQCISDDGETASPTPAPAAPEILVVSGACQFQSGLNGEWQRAGYTKTGHAYYMKDWRSLYFDFSCNGAGFTSTWVFDSSEPEVDRDSDLDNDGICSFIGYHFSSSEVPHLGVVEWNIFCGTWFDPVALTMESGVVPTTAPTPAPGLTEAPTPAPATSLGFTVANACEEKSYLDGTYSPEGLTASGLPYYKHVLYPLYVYWDQHCDGAAFPSAWVFDNEIPSTSAVSDLDGDGQCSFFGFMESPKQHLEPGQLTFNIFCAAWSPVVLTVSLAATPTPTPEPTPEATPAPTLVPTASPTTQPTAVPTAIPTALPTAAPTAGPTAFPTATPTASPTALPTEAPTALPTAAPTAGPTALPTATPTASPTAQPTDVPIAAGLSDPTAMPTPGPAETPTYISYLEFIVAGLNYSSLAASEELMTAFTARIANTTCNSVGLPAYNCSVIVFAAPLKVGVTIGSRTSYEDASVIVAALEEVNETLQTDVVESLHTEPHIMAVAESISIGTSELQVSIRTDLPSGGADEASAQGDPHISSVTGRKFDVNLPGVYVLIRAPQDRRRPAKLEVNATLAPSAGAPCGLYIKSIQLGGAWLANQLVDVLPLQRDVEGRNGAGSRTVRPFSVRVQAGDQQGEHEPWRDLGGKGRLLTGRVRLFPVWRQVQADAGRTQEAEAFRFDIRGEGAEQVTSIEVAQGAHQALDVRAGGLRKLGFERLGGLLGTEEHDRQVEHFTDECKAQRMSAITRVRPEVLAPLASSMAASWDELL